MRCCVRHTLFNRTMLVERDAILEALAALLNDAGEGDGRLVFVSGEAGIGKTAVVNAFASSVASRATVLRGTCDRLAGEALSPFVEACPALLIDDAAPNRRRLLGDIRHALEAPPTVLVLEDIHWADEASLDVLRYLGRRLAGLPVLIIATFRDDEVGRHHPLTDVLGDLARLPRVSRLTVPALTSSGIGALVVDADADTDVEDLLLLTRGNAFFVTEILSAGGSYVGARSDQIPATVRDAVLTRAWRLSAGAQRVLGAAAVFAVRAEPAVLVDVSGGSPEDVDEAVSAGVLVRDEHMLTFRHELARQAIEQTLEPSARHVLHAAAYRVLKGRGTAEEWLLAHHAAGCANASAVAVHGPRAAALAAARGSHREAVHLYTLTLRHAELVPAQRAELFSQLSYECYLTDLIDDAITYRRSALELYEQLDETERVGSSQRWLSRMSWFAGRRADSERYAALAVGTLEKLTPGHELAMAYSNRAQLCMLDHDLASVLEWGDRALKLARSIGDQDTEIHALNNVGTSMMMGTDVLEGQALLQRSLDLALSIDAHEHAARAYTNLSSTAGSLGHLAEADRILASGIKYCDERDLDSWRLYMLGWLARVRTFQGRYEEAGQAVAEVLRHSNVPAPTRINVLVASAQIAARRGLEHATQLDQALDLAIPTGEVQRLIPVACARAEAAWVSGRLDEVVAEVDRVWAHAMVRSDAWGVGELLVWLMFAGVQRAAPIALPEAFALTVAGDWTTAADRWHQLGFPLWRALALGLSPQLEDGRTAIAILDKLAVPAMRAAVLRERHARGLPVPRGPRGGPSTHGTGLTTRELDVLALLADGLSNAEIGDRLFVSGKTAGHHVSAILRKLGASSRSRAVAEAKSLGLLH